MPSIINLSPIWEHTLTDIINHGNKTEMGIIMRSWVKHNNLEDMSDLLIYDLNDFTPGGTFCHYQETAEAEETKLMPNTPLKELYNLYRYIQHLILESEFDYDDDEFDDPLDEGNWLLQTRGKYMKFVIYHSSTATEPRTTSHQKLVSFRKGIKREKTAYPKLKDEKYFDSFSRSLYITAKSHECEDVLDPEYTPSNSEKELFEAKQVFMFSVLDKHLLTDMGKTIVRKYVHTTDAQSVWKDFQEHMKSSSKGASEKRRLTQYVTNTVLDDNYKGTTEQFVLHFNEQFRQLEEISEESEHFPPQIKLQLLQNAVRPINDLRIVETLDKFQSITTGYGRSSSLKYQTYYDLLINACIRYDRTKKANVAKRGHIYQTTFSQSNDNFIDHIPSETPIGDTYMGIDIPSDEFYNIHTNQSGPPMSARHKLQPRLLRSNPNNKPNTFPKKPARQKWTGPIYLQGHIYKLLNQEAKDALQKYNVEAIQKFKASRNLNETELKHNICEHAQEELPTSINEEEFQECQQFNTDQDLEPPTDDILEFITSQDHSDDQLDQVLQTYQVYQQSQFETETPPRQMNAHITYHVAQAKQAKHGSLVDRGANGGLAGSDVRILSTSPRKCTATGIDNHEIPGLDFGTMCCTGTNKSWYGKSHHE